LRTGARTIEGDYWYRPEEAQEKARRSFAVEALPDSLNTIAPGHLLFGLSPVAGRSAEALGFRKALRALRARLIHVGHRRRGDDLARAGLGGALADATTGVVLIGMDNGYRPASKPGAFMLCQGVRCPVLGVSAEYTVIDLSTAPGAAVGDVVTVIGEDGGDVIAVESLAEQVGAPSAAYWMLGLRAVPMRYAASPKASAISS
jgi:alanine racemase